MQTLPFLLVALLPTQPKPAADRVLFDFTDPAAVRQFSNLKLPDDNEPRATWVADKGRLKITFAGGNWPTITTTDIPEDWMPYHTFHATVTVSRPCLVGFTVFQEKSRRGGGWDATVGRWSKTVFAQPGKNEVTAVLHPDGYSINAKLGKVERFEIFMYNPEPGETIYVENIRLSPAKLPIKKSTTQFRVLGTDTTVTGIMELSKKLKDQWKPPTPKSVDDIESEFRATYAELKKKHPKAALAVFRNGQGGYDPKQPFKVFAGWKDAYWSSHGPDGETVQRARNHGKDPSHEMFMRHRSPLMRVDLASIPKGSKILAARFIVVRIGDTYDKERDPRKIPNMWVAEACNRPWEEYEVNAYEYAKNKFWRDYGGTYYQGDDPDFLPLYLAHGPGGGAVSSWDFTEAVKYWTNGKNANHGFMMHGDARDWMQRAHYRESKEVHNRPGLLVVYEPAEGR